MILRELDNIQGIGLGGHNINNLRYADDTVLIAQSEQSLQKMLDIVVKESEIKGLSLNIAKTGHIYRARGIEHLAMTGKINGKKSRGRQRTTYVDSLNIWANLEQHTRSQFMRSSCERQIWKTMTVNARSRHGT
ncbi:hypothetical protein ElyMa_005743300 [Elysia marginata]|uniref:Reverse transcriptase domain-containing protein n=1 Tax=Elysia marginata TaxID=1093978 RepID=A0AAV4FKT5_9GAST|nr:hypothetical protein ElyMa_005743300 [Elysia marginata]